MPFGPVEAEVRLRFARPMQLGTDAGIVGTERAVGQAGPEAADIGREPAARPGSTL